MIRIFKTIKNNWKKTVFCVTVFSYGSNFLNREYKKNLLIRKYCREAAKFGDIPLNVLQSPRHVVVILNPSCNNRKAKKEYEKYCVPLLNLSGAYITLLTTNEETGAINLAGKIPNTANAIIIAGGDGTVSEVVTGLLRLKMDGSLQELLPVGILPLGKTNSLANDLYVTNLSKININGLYRFHVMMEATFSIITEITNNINIMEIKNIDNNNNENEYKPVYAVNHLHMGVFRDANAKIDKYWYFGKLRSYALYLFGSFNGNSPINAELSYAPPCSGCSKCYLNRKDLLKNADNVNNGRWWHAFVPRFRKPFDYVPTFKNYNKIENTSCNQIHKFSVKSVELSISPQLIDDTPSLRIDIGPESLSYIDLVKEGWLRIEGESSIKDHSIRRIDAQKLYVALKYKNQEHECWLSIDNEKYEFRKIKVKLLHNILPVFVPSDLNLITR